MSKNVSPSPSRKERKPAGIKVSEGSKVGEPGPDADRRRDLSAQSAELVVDVIDSILKTVLNPRFQMKNAVAGFNRWKSSFGEEIGHHTTQ